MSTNDLAKALLELDVGLGPGAADPRRLTREILKRDRRRVRLLAGLTVLLWLAAGAGLAFLVLSLDWYIRAVRTASLMPGQPVTEGTGPLHHSVPYVLGSIAALLLAGFCTVALVLSSRRAALRQVNAGLLEISEQLKQLGRAGAS
jgi:hypothetical protein